MKWSWTIGRVAGIKLRVHVTFVLLLVWVAYAAYREAGTLASVLRGVLFMLAVFGSVLLHELGHAVAGGRLGVPTRDINLLPIGGVARLERMPDEPKQELVIALAGPAVTVLIVLVLATALRVLALPALISEQAISRGTPGALLAQLMWVNVTLLVFNLLPAFPMDGGRVLRAALSLRMSAVRATAIAARVGRMFAILFAGFGLFYNPFLVLIAVFVWVSAAAESSALRERVALTGIPVRRIMVRDVRTLAPDDTLKVALDRVLTGFQHDFPVVDGEEIVGVLTQPALLEGVARRGPESPVHAAMNASFRTANPDEPVTRALARLRECGCLALPVVRDGLLCGLLTEENVRELVAVEAALQATDRHGGERAPSSSASGEDVLVMREKP